MNGTAYLLLGYFALIAVAANIFAWFNYKAHKRDKEKNDNL